MTMQRHSRAGWSAQEDSALFECAQQAQQSGQPLKSVFDRIAAETGRRPNSVRNYYYARVKQGGAPAAHSPAFIPFTPDEERALLTEVLRAQAAGESVRACTMRLGQGDNRAMLRCQNKYRALIRGNPALVGRVRQALLEQGVAAPDPYAPPAGKRRAGRPRKQAKGLSVTPEQALDALYRVEGLDADAFLTGLGTLALAAVNTVPAHEQADGAAPRLQLENTLLRQERDRHREQCMTLLKHFKRLADVNMRFLALSAQSKRSSLAGYIRELEANLAPCEELIAAES